MKENHFEEKIVSVEKFKDFRGLDLSNKDFRNISIDILMTTDFDSLTKWPSQEKLPVNFNPEAILENGKNPGLGLDELHKQGVTGKGINVAIIDQKLDLNHKEYSSNVVDYEEFGKSKKEDISMHGPAVASLFVGKSCGVAPEARLHYKAIPSGDNQNWEYSAESLNKIINYNDTVEDKNKIKVVSYSNGYPNPFFKGDLDNWKKTIEKARESGIIVVDGNTLIDSNFIGGGSFDDKENIDKYNKWLGLEDDKKKEGLYIPYSLQGEDGIIIPCDYRTVASSQKEKNGYLFLHTVGISGSVPYLAGLFSLMLQVNKNLKMEEMTKIIHDTAITNKNGLKIINPKGIIDLVKSIL